MFGDTYGAARSGGRLHEGVDIISKAGQNVYAVKNGVLTKKYVDAPESYASYTADKELGAIRGVGGRLAVGYLVLDGAGPRLRLDARVQLLHYSYPDFQFLSARTSLFTDLGARLEY